MSKYDPIVRKHVPFPGKQDKVGSPIVGNQKKPPHGRLFSWVPRYGGLPRLPSRGGIGKKLHLDAIAAGILCPVKRRVGPFQHGIDRFVILSG